MRNTELDVENCLRNVLFCLIFKVQSFYFFSQCGFNLRKKYTLFIKICKEDDLYYQETERNSMSLDNMLKIVQNVLSDLLNVFNQDDFDSMK